MKLDFTEEEKKDVMSIIKEYENVSGDMENLKMQSDEIQKRVDLCENKLNSLKQIETALFEKLRKKYGNFTLQDISDTIYGR